MASADAFYVTTPIYYVNDVPHIGHAYTTLACDTIARFARLDGRRVRFLTGTDEHGQKVEKAAAAAGMAPQAFTDRGLAGGSASSPGACGSPTTTSSAPPSRATCVGVQALWRELVRARSDLSRHAMPAGTRCATSPSSPRASWSDGLAPTGAPVEWVEEPSYFFRLSAWQEPLLRLYEEHPDFILPPSRRNEVISFVKGGLQDLSVSRTSFSWGIPVPDDPEHVVYVWLDALTNYMTALGYPDTDAEAYRTFWPADVHVVGKDILRFHAVFWPAFLLAAGLEPPRRVFAHGWWTNEGQKISKSLGNVIDPIAADRDLRARSDPLFPAARGAVRQRRRLLARGHDHPDEPRPGQRLRQSGAARAVDDPAQLRRAGCRQPGAYDDDDRRLLEASGGAARRGCAPRWRSRR